MVGETRDQFDGLAHQVVTGSIVRIRIERIHFQNTTGKDIHDILPLPDRGYSSWFSAPTAYYRRSSL